MLDTIVKWITGLIPFITPYPIWVKLAFAVFILSGATWIVGLVIAAPKPFPQKPVGEESAWLTVKGVTGFGSIQAEGVRVTATVNGIEYVYPTLRDVDWLQIGPDMAPQTFQIPVRDTYAVRFAAQLRDGRFLVSVEEQHITGKTDGVRIFAVHELSRGQRSSPVAAEIRYIITRGNP